MSRVFRAMPVWLIVATMILLPAIGLAAEQLSVRHYDSREGIPQIQVIAVRQDTQGYLWVGTFGGVARYNGHAFRIFGTSDGLNSNYANTIEIDDDGRLWVGTAQGVCRYVSDAFECPDIPGFDSVMVNDILATEAGLWLAADEGLFQLRNDRVVGVSLDQDHRPAAVLSLALDPRGRLWVGTSRGIFIREADGFKAIPTPGGHVHSMAVKGDRVWTGTANGLFMIDVNGHDIAKVMLPHDANAQINHVHVDPASVVWASSVEGVFRIDNDQVTHYTTEAGLKNNIVHEIMTDREGLTWFGTDQGLTKLLPGPLAGYNADSGLLASFVRTINEDADRRLWLGTRQGVQRVPFRDGDWRFEDSDIIRTEQGLPDNRIYSVVFPEPGRAYIATAEGVVHWDDEQGVVEIFSEADGLASNEVHALLIDRQDRLWISSTRGVSVMSEGQIAPAPDDQLAGAFAIRIREDAHGRLWFATLRDGLIILEPDGNAVSLRSEQGLTDEMLWDVAPAGDDSMWVGSNGAGLFRVWPDGRTVRLTDEDGMADNAVWQVLQDEQGAVWAYTNHGLSRLEDGEFTNFLERDGLLHLEGGATGAFQSSDGLLWFASADGLMRYDAEREYTNTVPPPVVIEGVVRGRDAVEPEEQLPHRAGTLEFRYAGLTFQDEAAVRFRYRLIGADDQWSEPTSSRSVTFANLGFGEYVFEVRAYNPHGVPSMEPARFSFSVQRPFWLSWWFILSVLAAVALATRMVIGWRLRQAEVARDQLQAIVNQRTAELEELNQRLRAASRTDQLTRLPNRRYLFDRIGNDVARVHRAYSEKGRTQNRDLVFMMIDLDHFKQVNDEHGHDAGDRVLVEFSQTLVEHMRDSDYTVRWGGEEFLVVACQAESSQVRLMADRLVRNIRAWRFTIDDAGTQIRVTCSIGIACYPVNVNDPERLDWEQTVQIADMAVYQAKSLGRDGWVQLILGEQARIEDPATFVDRIRTNLDEMLANDEIRRITSRD